MDPHTHQVGGDHYKHYVIQPIEYITANNLPFIEGCIVKYISRWRQKGGVEDLEKVKHYVDLLIAAEAKSTGKGSWVPPLSQVSHYIGEERPLIYAQLYQKDNG